MYNNYRITSIVPIRTHPHGRIKWSKIVLGSPTRIVVVVVVVSKSILLHDPLRLHPLRVLALVEHQRLLHPDFDLPLARRHRPVSPGRLPVPRQPSPVRPDAVRVLSVQRAEEIPLPVAVNRLLCTRIYIYKSLIIKHARYQNYISESIYQL